MSESICVCREHFNGFKAFLGKVSGRGCWEADDRSSQLSLSITLPSVSHLSLSLSLRPMGRSWFSNPRHFILFSN